MKKILCISILATYLFNINSTSSAHPVRYKESFHMDTMCRVQYLKKVLADTGIFSPWLVIKIVQSHEEKLIAVENHYLYNYMNHIYKYDFKTYQDKMFSLLMKDKPLALSTDISNHPFFRIDTSSSAHKLVREQGIDSLRAHYYADENFAGISLWGLDFFFDSNYIITRGDITPALIITRFDCK